LHLNTLFTSLSYLVSYENQQVACFAGRDSSRPSILHEKLDGARDREEWVLATWKWRGTFRETNETPEIVRQLFARPKARRICARGDGKHGPSSWEFDAVP